MSLGWVLRGSAESIIGLRSVLLHTCCTQDAEPSRVQELDAIVMEASEPLVLDLSNTPEPPERLTDVAKAEWERFDRGVLAI